VYQVKPSITLGNQKWKGAAPIFNIIVEEIAIEIKLKLILKVENMKNKIIKNKKIAEAIAWVKKYFKEDSEDIKFFETIIKGIKESKLISKPIQILSQEVEDTAIKVPKIIELKNKNLYEFFKIKKKRTKTFINRVWT
jgi:hypothetical protein